MGLSVSHGSYGGCNGLGHSKRKRREGSPIFDFNFNIKISVVGCVMKLLTQKPMLLLGVSKYLPESVGGGQAHVDCADAHPSR